MCSFQYLLLNTRIAGQKAEEILNKFSILYKLAYLIILNKFSILYKLAYLIIFECSQLKKRYLGLHDF
jgi:hypothetical protein